MFYFDIDELEKRLRPGAYSTEGFLSPNEKLLDVTSKDNAYLQSLGITHEEIADILECYSMNDTSLYYFKREKYLGCQECPFCEKEVYDSHMHKHYGSQDVTIIDRENNTKLVFSDLMIHLIRDHHFFEGSTKYRLDPSKVVEFFGVNVIRGFNCSRERVIPKKLSDNKNMIKLTEFGGPNYEIGF